MEFFESLKSIETFDALINYTHIVPSVALGIYFILIFGLPKVLPKDGINIKPILIVWNLFFSIFSLFMLFGSMIPYFSNFLFKYSFLENFCDVHHKLYEKSSMIMWGSLFILSKYLELFDTIFIVIKHPTKNIEFLQWYHHSSVIIFTWYGWYYKFHPAFLCMPINAAIHVVMYFYYMLKELGYNPSWNKMLTLAQTIQMFIGLAINIYWIYLVYFTSYPCDCSNNTVMMIMSVFIYASYLYLFAKFYQKRYKTVKKE